MPAFEFSPAQKKVLQKAADTCVRCKPVLTKMREMGASVEDEEARVRHLEEMLLAALGYERAANGEPPS